MGRIGVFGGSFNPPHQGHVQAVCAAREALSLDRVLLMPAATPPHKVLPPHSPDAAQRMELTRLAFRGLPWAEVSDLELRRSGPSYTADTLQELEAAYPGQELVLILGTDMFLTVHRWVRAEEILRKARIAFVSRAELSDRSEIEAQTARLLGCGARVSVVDNPVLELSSTTVRRMLAFGCADALLPAAVAEAVAAGGYYTQPDSLRGLSLPELETAAIALLDETRVAHVLGCRDTAVALAERYGADVTDARRAALLHDVTKALPTAQQLQLCRRYGMINQSFDSIVPNLLHAMTGAMAAEHVFGESPAVCEAIRWHTTGRPDMTLLEKILYLADFIEPTRRFKEVTELREAVWKDLDSGLLLGLEMSVDWLRELGRPVSRESIDARDWLREALHETGSLS